MFHKRWKEGDPLPRMMRSARWRSILVVLLCAGFFAFSYYSIDARLVPENPPEKDFWNGVFWMTVSGICFAAFLPSVFVPTRVTMDSEGFTVRNFWRGEKIYRWKDIAHFDITPGSYPMVYWLDKVRKERRWRHIYDHDHRLPSALWQHRPMDRFLILSGWLDEYNERQAKRR